MMRPRYTPITRKQVTVTLAVLLVLMIPLQFTVHHEHHPIRKLQHMTTETKASSSPPPSAPPEPQEDEARIEAILACYDNPHHCEAVAKSRDACYNNVTISQQLCKVSCDSCESLKQSISSDADVDVEIRDSYMCADDDELCAKWSAKGWCTSHLNWMLSRCKATCKFCQTVPNFGKDSAANWADLCADDVDLCPFWATTGSCSSYSWMNTVCRLSCGKCGGSTQVAQLQRVQELTSLHDPGTCMDFNTLCQRWAAAGQCNYNQEYMATFCRQSCGLCSVTDEQLRQKQQMEQEQAWRRAQQRASAQQQQVLAEQAKLREKRVEAAAGGSLVGKVGFDVFGTPLQTLELLNCKDDNKDCGGWVLTDQCHKNAGFMSLACKRSCGLCLSYCIRQAPKAVRLNSGHMMPMVGFGTAGLGELTKEAVSAALTAGYRHIDSAQSRQWYREDLVGKAIAEATAKGIQRSQMFITSKLHPRHHGFTTASQQFEQSLKELGTEYVDLFLLHYPDCWVDICGHDKPEGKWQDSWRALEVKVQEGKIRSLGVSNFDVNQVRELVAMSKVKPAVVQAHADPLNQNNALVTFCHEHGIVFTAYSSLGTQAQHGLNGANAVTSNPTINAIARQVDRTVVQVVLRWALQSGMVVLPRSANPEHISSNLRVFEFELPDVAMQKMLAMDGMRLGM